MKLHLPPFRSIQVPRTQSARIAPRLPLSKQVCPAQSRVSAPVQGHRTYATQHVPAAELKFGQPLHETHPHLLKPGEITPGISAQEYADRRAALAHSMTVGSIAILHAAPLVYKSGAVFHPYRQESNFFWLTGWKEPDAIAIIEKTGPNLGDYTFRMFCKKKDPREEQWSGYRNGVQAAEDVFNADEAHAIERAEVELPKILGSAKLVYTDIPSYKDDSPLHRFFHRDSGPSRTPLFPVMNKLRAIKSSAEVVNMRRAGQISGRAITDAMRQPWKREKDLHAFLDYQFSIQGCDGPAYIPVVAGGERGNCIHYTINDNIFQQDEFIMVDAGAEYGTYITDITRTWPASGRFTPAQRDLYEAVLKVQRTSVSLCRADANMSLEDIHRITARGLVDQLKSIGFSVDMSNISALFPHHVGHYVGLDVHDCPGYSRREILKRGHCVTIEPGVYIAPDDERWPAHFRGMGVRIEDSVCVDDDSPYILSREAVKEITDIEALREV